MLIGCSLSARAQYSVIYSFKGGSDGLLPWGTLTIDQAGNLYGTTQYGGFPGPCYSGCGTIFEISPGGQETILHSFTGGRDGYDPIVGLTQTAPGNYYGATASGGLPPAGMGFGVIFGLNNGIERVIYTFKGKDGWAPDAVQPQPDGSLIGTAANGGMLSGVCTVYGCGTVFRIDATGNETTLYTFRGGADGGVPTGGVFEDADGNLYGTAAEGGSDLSGCGGFGCGVFYRINPLGNEAVLFNFGEGDGNPVGPLVADADGNLYGTTLQGNGVVFKLNLQGEGGVLYAFQGHSDGAAPGRGGLIRDAAGNLYGVTSFDGTNDNGTIFKVTPSGQETVLYRFGGGADGSEPVGGLVAFGGYLYGTTSIGGISSTDCFGGLGCGVVFKLKLPD
jgi:uncharacterized repeat protein (TIGR03803 family)